MHKTCLQLVIREHLCICGNRWVHSYQLLDSTDGSFYGGTPNPNEILALLTPSYDPPSKRTTPNHSTCFRCIVASGAKPYTDRVGRKPQLSAYPPPIQRAADPKPSTTLIDSLDDLLPDKD